MPLRLAANENIPGPAVAALRTAGHDVTWAVEETRGWNDPEVLAKAAAEGRVLLTFDKDFGELVFRRGLGSSAGVVLFRISVRSPEAAAAVVLSVLELHGKQFAGHFTVVEDARIRIVPLPQPRRD